ncbi:thiol-activated cytolysin family protein [Bacteroides helcogenes]|uniref:Thiol-activated cytolysin n=1 Tax=Bacteroides helcogenes (strain ATCC 35417 / DSM 20613 / JCM 6297 / CCUG 15421 / P 36-108) TaxID=693979 RepID=E6SWX3_BACT6|nr:thiol-activated cytolysin family protein [Bacteroides helcogenes]ADV44661.1 Thiol-activated cytolysin [Bacteroides helcogenes P 36-108]MDY5238954.1 thiol-activated cytolysin family protein [Bacteroides helcogenes]
MNKLIISGFYVILCSVFIFSSCSNDDSLPGNGLLGETAKSLDGYISSLPSIEQIKPFKERVVQQPESRSSVFGGAYLYTRASGNSSGQEFEQANEVEEQLLFSEDQEIFYPGALIKAKNIVNGSYTPIIVPRNPITISTSLVGDKKSSVTVEDPKLSTVRDALNDLLTRTYDTPSANITYSSEEVYDETYLKLALGANYTGTVGSVKASGLFSFKKEKNHFLVKIQQVFYTIDIDLPSKPSDFFSQADFDYKSLLGDEKPVYISSIKMGRVFLLGIETTMSKVEAEAKIQASFLRGAFDANAETAFNDLSKKSVIKARVLGGNASLSAKAISDIKQLKTLLEDGAKFSRDNPGIAISYKMRELGTNNTFRTVIYSKYRKNDSRFNDKRLDFHLYFEKSYLKTVAGKDVPFTGQIYLEVQKADAPNSRKEAIWFYHGTFEREIIAFEKGDKIILTFDRRDKDDEYRDEYVFELPSFEKLMERAEAIDGKYPHLYDMQTNGALVIMDSTKQLLLKLELEKHRIYEK